MYTGRYKEKKQNRIYTPVHMIRRERNVTEGQLLKGYPWVKLLHGPAHFVAHTGIGDNIYESVVLATPQEVKCSVTKCFTGKTLFWCSLSLVSCRWSGRNNLCYVHRKDICSICPT